MPVQQTEKPSEILIHWEIIWAQSTNKVFNVANSIFPLNVSWFEEVVKLRLLPPYISSHASAKISSVGG